MNKTNEEKMQQMEAYILLLLKTNADLKEAFQFMEGRLNEERRIRMKNDNFIIEEILNAEERIEAIESDQKQTTFGGA